MYSDGPNRFWGTSTNLVVRWDGAKLAHWWLPDLHPRAIWGTDAEVWVATLDGTAVRFRSGTWSSQIHVASNSLTSVSGVADGGAWFTSEGALYHVDESGAVSKAGGWRRVSFDGIWAASATDVWAVGSETVGTELRWRVGRYDGKRWLDTSLPGTTHPVSPVASIAGTSDRDVWAFADDMYHWDGVRWMAVPYPSYPQSVSTSGRDDVIVSGQHGFSRWNGKAWDVTPGLDFVHEIAVGAGLVATSNYLLIDRAGKSTAIPNAGSGIRADGFWVGPDAVWEIGRPRLHADFSIAVARFDGSQWTNESLGPGTALAIGGVDSPVILDSKGGLWRRNSGSWRREDTGLRDAEFLVVLSDDDIWIANASGQIAHGTQGRWMIVPTLAGIEIRACAASPGHEIFALVKRGANAPVELARFDGRSFVRLAPVDDDAKGLAIRNDRDVVFRSSHGIAEWQPDDTAPAHSSEVDDLQGVTAVALTNSATFIAGMRYRGATGLEVKRGHTTDWVNIPDFGDSDDVAVRDGVVWLMAGQSGDLMVLREP